LCGLVRRLPSGYNASDEAIEAHNDAQRRAELANDAPLKPGYTFVRRTAGITDPDVTNESGPECAGQQMTQ
jgi:hypothetical protein